MPSTWFWPFSATFNQPFLSFEIGFGFVLFTLQSVPKLQIIIKRNPLLNQQLSTDIRWILLSLFDKIIKRSNVAIDHFNQVVRRSEDWAKCKRHNGQEVAKVLSAFSHLSHRDKPNRNCTKSKEWSFYPSISLSILLSLYPSATFFCLFSPKSGGKVEKTVPPIGPAIGPISPTLSLSGWRFS